ncbi:hypothetical protein Hypma_013547 [Hypsizygus marmoreus]|uniref:Uncharacterized protein n=1 Tax=Hypsizygus marmoreus TaxID=39966 RepID=A0A369JBD2_HYPMA|nr:hypothetical protein Hypma_013547 [Hypsizygus marmoreus]
MGKTALSKKGSDSTHAKGRGKQPKRFLERNDALELAASIADLQEEKSLSKAEKHHHAQAGQPQEDPKLKISASKLKLKETKALLAAKRTQVKKEKIKLKKQRSADGPATKGAPVASPAEETRKVAQRKSVSFA